MKRIFLIATGGTIACGETGDGLIPSIDAKQILAYIPEVESLCHLEGISIMSVDSTNMNPSLMVKIAEAVGDHYENYDGFVISHGTDTMGYTAAALTYMLKNLEKPVVITGSQIPIEALYTDAKINLSDAIRFACEDITGVYVAFDSLIISGVHAMKMKTRSTDAFSSINFPVIAEIKLGRITYNQALTYGNHWDKLRPEGNKQFHIKTKLCQNIVVLKIFPGIGTEILDFIKDNYKGVIIESFGIGGIPSQDNDIVSKVHELVEAGLAVVIATQCIYEGIDLDIYEVGQKLARQQAIIGADMTTEACVMKLMWALGNYDNLADVKKCMETSCFADRSY